MGNVWSITGINYSDFGKIFEEYVDEDEIYHSVIFIKELYELDLDGSTQ